MVDKLNEYEVGSGCAREIRWENRHMQFSTQALEENARNKRSKTVQNDETIKDSVENHRKLSVIKPFPSINGKVLVENGKISKPNIVTGTNKETGKDSPNAQHCSETFTKNNVKTLLMSLHPCIHIIRRQI